MLDPNTEETDARPEAPHEVDWAPVLVLLGLLVALGLYFLFVGVGPASAGCDVGH